MAARRFGFLAVIVALVVLAAPATGTRAAETRTSSPAPETTSPRERPECSLTVRRHPVESENASGQLYELRIRVRCDLPESVEEFRIDYAGSVIDRSGFAVAEGPSEVHWTRSTESPSVVIAQRTSDYPDVHVGRDYAITDGWAFVPKPGIEFRWSFEGSGRTHTYEPFAAIDSFRSGFPWSPTDDPIGTTIDLRGGGFVSDRMLYVGGYTEYLARADGQRIRLIVPDSATVAAGPKRIVRAVSAASERLRIGGKDPEVLIFAAPDPLRRPTVRGWIRGYAYRDAGEVVVNDAMPLDAPRSTWLHEYVHTRQSFSLAPRMRWFLEASAEYYGGLLVYEHDRISATALYRSVRWSGVGETVLSNASTWGRTPPYYKGSTVLYALDSEIRAETDGEATLRSVVRRLNTQPGVVTLEDFKDAVEAVSGRSMDAWIETYVTTARSPGVRSEETFLGGVGTVKDVRIVDTVDRDGDGDYSDFDVRVRLDTAIEGVDPFTGDGDPYLTVAVGNETVARTEVPWSVNYTATLPVNGSSLDRFGPGRITVTVALWDRDAGSDDRIAARTVTVGFEPREPSASRSVGWCYGIGHGSRLGTNPI